MDSRHFMIYYALDLKMIDYFNSQITSFKQPVFLNS